ncbi:MAG: hypothetical protein ACFE96_04130 [Candidatus Hermodarchaeota archaeon]
MGKVFGIISLVCGLISFFMTPVTYFAIPVGPRIALTLLIPVIFGTGIIMGALGIAKDDGKGLGIAGLIISHIALFNFMAGTVLSFLGITY